MVKLTNENYAIKKNLEGLKDLLEKEQKDKTELEATCSLNRENFEQQLLKLEKASDAIKSENADLKSQLKACGGNEEKLTQAKEEIERLNAELKSSKKIHSARLGKLETSLSDKTSSADALKKQLSKETAAREKAEEQLKSQLESNKKLSLLNKLTKEKSDKSSSAEKELRVKTEENKVCFGLQIN